MAMCIAGYFAGAVVVVIHMRCSDGADPLQLPLGCSRRTTNDDDVRHRSVDIPTLRSFPIPLPCLIIIITWIAELLLNIIVSLIYSGQHVPSTALVHAIASAFPRQEISSADLLQQRQQGKL